MSEGEKPMKFTSPELASMRGDARTLAFLAAAKRAEMEEALRRADDLAVIVKALETAARQLHRKPDHD